MEHLERLYNELLNKDWFMTFPDFKAYCQAREQALSDYENRTAWARKMLINISKAGYFSSDRTIEEYEQGYMEVRYGSGTIICNKIGRIFIKFSKSYAILCVILLQWYNETSKGA